MKIALFGATGRTGSIFLRKALEKGHHVKALVRDPTKVTTDVENLILISGDFQNPEDIEKTVRGTNVVVSLLGHVKGSPANLQATGTENTIQSKNAFSLQWIIHPYFSLNPFESIVVLMLIST